jgi:filamentous hemagglutinin family protein
MHPRLRHLPLAKPPLPKRRLIIAWALLALGASPAAAEPTGGTVVGGAATIQGQGTPAVIVNQASSSAVINWNTFNIRANESVRFNQPSSSSVVLNRVTGGQGPSEIMGTLTANGRVFLINRDGILFGPGSVVNTAGFLATTNDIRNADFMAGRYNFNIPGRPDASIVNQGRITATSGGFAALVAPGVRNSGTITATLGTVALASGNSFTLDMYGDKLITLAVGDSIASKVIDVATGKPLRSLVSNTKNGTISANGGRVELTAAAARAVVDSVINTRGVIRADSIGHRNGLIVLNAATGGSKPAGAPAQTIKLAGTISAAGRHRGTTGGTVVVSGEHIKLANAKIDASGRRGGGKVLIGGDWGGGHPNTTLISNASAKLENFTIATATTVSVDARSTINASATGRGNGGKVVLWSDSQTTFAGTILAKGGTKSGDGGFVETSSHGQLAFAGHVDASAPLGKAGTLLLDPEHINIVSNCDGPCGPSEILASDIRDQLANQNVVIATNLTVEGDGDIDVRASINWSTNNSLTLSAYHDINIFDYYTPVTITNTAGGSLVLRADNTGTGQGTVNFRPTNTEGPYYPQGSVNLAGGTTSIFFNPSVNPPNSVVNSTSYVNPSENYSQYVTGNLTAYMLVNTAYDLQNIRNKQDGTYALGRNIDASAIPNFTPIPNFTGLFDGQGQTIANLTIAPNDSTTHNVGLFGVIGPTGVVRNLNLANVDVTANPGVTFQTVGTLAGTNQGTISGVTATGSVDGGTVSGAILGGLVGANGTFDFGGHPGLIIGSKADVTVSSAGVNVALGGLAGVNSPGSTIIGSFATGDVIATATVAKGGPDCGSSNTSCQHVSAGGLVGENFGTIAFSFATGDVSVGPNGTAGGLAGLNSGIITNAFAAGNVTGAPGTGGVDGEGGSTTLGGLAGVNQGLISNSGAIGDVGGLNVANLQAGGLVGDNSGTIVSSFAAGTVQAGDGSNAGGLVASNSINNFNCAGCIIGDGNATFNTAFIFDSHAFGNVTVGATSVAGGLVGASDGFIANSFAFGNVTGGGNSVLGGFIGALSFENGPGLILASASAGSVTSTGPNSIVGGFAGLTGGTIFASVSTGAVTGTSDSYLGGFAGVNLGTIAASLTTPDASVTGTGNHDVIGGFVGANFGSIDSSSSAGNASGATNSLVGGFAGINARFINFAAGSISGSSFPSGSITNSSASGSATGGPGSTTDPFVAANDPTSASRPPAFPSIVGNCSDALCIFVNTGILPPPSGTPLAEFLESLAAQQTQIIQNLTATTQLAALSTPPVITDVQNGIRLPPQPPPAPPPGAAGQQILPGLDRRVVDIPPLTETRLIQDEVVVQIASTMTAERLQAAVSRLGLTVIESENLTNSGSIVVRLRITNGRTPAAAIQSMANVGMAAITQPNYVYALQQPAADPAPAARGDTSQQGDAAQYILEKLKMLDVHRMVRGANVPIAVIDSEIDVTHPDLVGVVAQRFSAVGGAPEKPHSHGTGMAGAIAARQKVLGTAPAARLLAVHAFSSNAANAESTTFNILKGIDWAVGQGARVINMSFAGPKDPSLARAIKLAYDRGIVPVAAAGNAGAKSPPLFPGADPFVIAVTATDVADKLFTGANRGKYISVAAPGVDILVPAPENNYQLTTGTSVAAAEVSGIVALLLERNPKLTPADIRRILTASARRLGSADRDDDFGSGLIDPLKALQLADPRIVSTAPPSAPTPTPASAPVGTPSPTLRQR